MPWVERFALDGIHVVDPSEPVYAGSESSELHLSAPMTITADRVILRGHIFTEGFPLTIVARVLEFDSSSRIKGYSESNHPPAQTAIPPQAGPGAPGVDQPRGGTRIGGWGGQGAAGLTGVAGIEGNQNPGAITLVGLYVVGSLNIQAKGQAGGQGGPGGQGGIGGTGGQGSAAIARCLGASNQEAGPGGYGGLGGVGGAGGNGGRAGNPIPLDLRLDFSDLLANRPQSLPGAPGLGGPGGMPGTPGSAGAGGLGDFTLCAPYIFGRSECAVGPPGALFYPLVAHRYRAVPQGSVGAIGEANPITAQSVQHINDLHPIALLRENVLQNALWVHLWRRLRLRVGALDRMLVRLSLDGPQTAARSAQADPLGGIAGPHLDEAESYTFQDLLQLRQFPLFSIHAPGESLSFADYLSNWNPTRRPLLGSSENATDLSAAELLQIFSDSRSLNMEFRRLGVGPLWNATVHSMAERLDRIRGPLFDQLRGACVAMANAQAQLAAEIIGTQEILSIPLCNPNERDVETTGDLWFMPRPRIQ